MEDAKREQRDGQSEERARPLRDRVGMAVSGLNAVSAVAAIRSAEEAGVRQVWMIQGAIAPDTLSTYAAAAVQTSSIRMGTSIVPTYPRHPLAMAQQALTLHDLAPGRLRLGVGPSHRPTIEWVYGLPMPSPLQHMREYVEVLRALLWAGKVDYQGRFFKVKAEMPRTTNTPILVSALRTGAFRLAGQIGDGAISWMCPVPYLLDKAMPALREGAHEAGEGGAGRQVPSLVAHVPVALSQDRQAVREAAHRQLGRYGRLPFYRGMFSDAGFPANDDGTLPDDLIDSLLVSGDDAAIASRVSELLAAGLDELLLQVVPLADLQEEQSRLAELIGHL